MTNNGLYNEQELLEQIARGDESAFTQLVDAYWRKIYGHALAYSKSVPLAEELTQDTFIAIWVNRGKLSSIENFPGYLYTILRNKLINAVRRKLSTTPVENEPLEETRWRPDIQMEYRQTYDILLKGIEELPPARKKVFMMSRMEGKSYEQIGEELQISRNTVKEHIARALNFLRSYFAQHHDSLISCLLLGFLWPG